MTHIVTQCATICLGLVYIFIFVNKIIQILKIKILTLNSQATQ